MQSTGGAADRPQPRPRPGQHLLLEDEPQAHGGRGRARQSALRCREPRSNHGRAGPRPRDRPEITAPQPVLPPCEGEARDCFFASSTRPNVLSCYRRSESVVPQQALALANSPLCHRAVAAPGREAGAELPRESSSASDDAFVTAAFERILGRCADCRRTSHLPGIPQHPGQPACRPRRPDRYSQPGHPSTVPPAADPAHRAREDLVHVLLNHNDFVTIR